MIDYYMGFLTRNDSHGQYGKWNTKVGKLAIGESFIVTTDSDRRGALRAGNRLGMMVKSAKCEEGYEMTRINTTTPRKKSHPKKWHI